MSWGRTLLTGVAFAAVTGGAVAAVAMARHHGTTVAERSTAVPTPTRTYRPAHPPVSTTAAAPIAAVASTSARPSTSTSTSAGVAPLATSRTAAPRPVAPTRAAPRTSTAPVVHRPTTRPAPKPTTTTRPAPKPAGGRLPLGYSTGSATRVITVVGSSHSSTVATLQAWTKSGTGWTKWGPAIRAHVGSDGLGNASEFRSATPTGSYTLTQAFGYYPNPGTGLSYFKTTSADWWISTKGRYYNTHQRCSNCGYGSPDEHLVSVRPYYNYAVNIDTPSGANAYPKGSAFFLHVTDGRPTAGCVAIPQSNLVTLLRWLTPAAHPRILIGVA